MPQDARPTDDARHADKAGLRLRLRQRRLDILPNHRARARERAAELARHLPPWAAARAIALYLPADGELDPGAIAEGAWATGKAVYLPLIKANQALDFARWEPETTLTPNRFGIPEPGPEAPRLRPADIDIIFTPLVGWSRTGGRLGMGGGFYDRTLAQGPLPSAIVGVGFALQEVAELPMEAWDVPLDYVVTERELVTCHRRAVSRRR